MAIIDQQGLENGLYLGVQVYNWARVYGPLIGPVMIQVVYIGRPISTVFFLFFLDLL